MDTQAGGDQERKDTVGICRSMGINQMGVWWIAYSVLLDQGIWGIIMSVIGGGTAEAVTAEG